MNSIIALFWRICVFQSGPDDVPGAHFLTVLVITVNILINITLSVLLFDEVSLLQASAGVVVLSTVVIALVWGILSLMNLSNRYPQTITALFGADLIMSLITSVVDLVGRAMDIGNNFGVVVVLLWQISVFGFVLHRAMNIHLGFGIATAFFINLLALAVRMSVLDG